MKCIVKQIPKLIESGIVTFQITKMPKTKEECIIFDAVARQSRKYGYFLVLKSKKFQDRMREFTCFDYKSYIRHAHVSIVMKLPQPPYTSPGFELQGKTIKLEKAISKLKNEKITDPMITYLKAIKLDRAYLDILIEVEHHNKKVILERQKLDKSNEVESK